MSSIGLVVGYVFVQMCVIWGLYRWLKNPSVVDVSWSLGLMVSGLIYLYSGPIANRSIIASVLLITWALRLSGYLWFSRIKKGHVDKRYLQLSDSWKISKSLGFFLNFQLQGLLILIISSVFWWLAQGHAGAWSMLDVVAVGVIIAGIAGESLADWQLQKFKSTHPGAVCDYGLWNYTRHPNYFFDWLTWLGFALLAWHGLWSGFGLIAPLMMYIIFTKMTGPLTEEGSVKSRGAKYRDYQKKTPMFFPNILRR